MNFIFWNIHHNPETFPIIVELLLKYDVDVFSIAEFPIQQKWKIINLLDAYGYKLQEPIMVVKNKIEYIHKNNISFERIDTGQRYSANQLSLGSMNINFIGCHLVDKRNFNEATQAQHARGFSRYIRGIENNAKNSRTIVVGDFNMNPFENGMIEIDALNSVHSLSIASKKIRKYNKEEYPFFYNPMWKFYAKSPININGTYYCQNSNTNSLYWNIFDQVLIRAPLIPYFIYDSLNIIHSLPNYSLITKNNLINRIFSDHLPIFFSLKNNLYEY